LRVQSLLLIVLANNFAFGSEPNATNMPTFRIPDKDISVSCTDQGTVDSIQQSYNYLKQKALSREEKEEPKTWGGFFGGGRKYVEVEGLQYYRCCGDTLDVAIQGEEGGVMKIVLIDRRYGHAILAGPMSGIENPQVGSIQISPRLGCVVTEVR
jgi:hypothetical protein